ncbi:hypothetical protein BD410DRAFT_545161 [Rickenella mellea]|uniref:Uncharacterized protein n=1 Tax=Rickenella mellea TaxID=50990 RepID=A0A4Y7PST5_9AGAM|nr:hypothetical protein BD410DRAFT_545161 [Rickenella mellea]
MAFNPKENTSVFLAATPAIQSRRVSVWDRVIARRGKKKCGHRFGVLDVSGRPSLGPSYVVILARCGCTWHQSQKLIAFFVSREVSALHHMELRCKRSRPGRSLFLLSAIKNHSVWEST